MKTFFLLIRNYRGINSKLYHQIRIQQPQKHMNMSSRTYMIVYNYMEPDTRIPGHISEYRDTFPKF